jgi:hypothetical protein
MSTEFSESELFVLGSLVAACDHPQTLFHSHLSELFRMLGLWREPPTTNLDSEPINNAPHDTVWGTADLFEESELVTDELETMRAAIPSPTSMPCCSPTGPRGCRTTRTRFSSAARRIARPMARPRPIPS